MCIERKSVVIPVIQLKQLTLLIYVTVIVLYNYIALNLTSIFVPRNFPLHWFVCCGHFQDQ